MELKGKTALITGGGTGFGYAIAQALASEGVRLMLAGRRSDPLRNAVKSLGDMGAES